VLLQQNKVTTTYKPEMYAVTSRTGREVTVQSPDGVQYRRNVAHVKKYVSSPGDHGSLSQSESADSHGSSDPIQKVEPASPHSGTVVDPREHSPIAARRSTRARDRPRYLEDYIILSCHFYVV